MQESDQTERKKERARTRERERESERATAIIVVPICALETPRRALFTVSCVDIYLKAIFGGKLGCKNIQYFES